MCDCIDVGCRGPGDKFCFGIHFGQTIFLVEADAARCDSVERFSDERFITNV